VSAEPAGRLRLIRKDQSSAETPPGHWDMQAHRLVDQETIRLQYCEMEGGGGAEAHVHDDVDQILLVVDGSLNVRASEGEDGITAGEGDAVYIPAGAPHATKPVNDQRVTYVAVTFPTS
jgi:quercetin dioxygenase-like cupin family protein